VALVFSLVSGVLFGQGFQAATVFAVLIVLLCLASCLQKFHRNSLSRMFANLPVMYLYYVGRSRSALDALRSGVADARARHR